MTSTVVTNARIVTPPPLVNGPHRGAAMDALRIIERGELVMENGRITEVGSVQTGRAAGAEGGGEVIDAGGRVVMPAFIDAHTHALWAGDRLDEFDMKQRGATYLEILESGGGIMSTVRAVRAASDDALAVNLRERLAWMRREGAAAVEVKSGYGLTTADELKMLRVIDRVARAADGDPSLPAVVPTALLGHAIDPDQPGFIERTIDETLPAVHEAFPEVAIDAYCERGAWSLDDCARLFERAIALGHPIRVHADQFNELGMTRWATEHGALSVDHLEATSPGELRRLAESGTMGVMLPCSGFQVDGRYADGRSFIDAGGALVIATNCNPGSAPTSSMPFAIALAVRDLGVTAHEAVTACTANAAALLGLPDRGALAPGLRADLVMLRHRDERMLGYEFGGDPVDAAWRGGSLALPVRSLGGSMD